MNVDAMWDEDVLVLTLPNNPSSIHVRQSDSDQAPRLVYAAEASCHSVVEDTCEMEYISDWMSWHCKSCDHMEMAPRNPRPIYCRWCGRRVRQ